MTKDTHATLYAALAAAQGEIQNPPKTKTAKAGTYQYKYADIADVLSSALPVLSKHGIAVTQPTRMADGVLWIETTLTHHCGETLSSEYPVCAIIGDHQKMGAAMTYARRYALCSLIGVAAEDDTDGQNAANPADKPATISEDQADTIKALLAELDMDTAARTKFLAWAKAPSIDAIRASDFETIVAKLRARLPNGSADK